jgi:hypothetical protein
MVASRGWAWPKTILSWLDLWVLEAVVVAVLTADFANRVEIGLDTHARIPCFTVKPHNLDSRIVLDAVTLNKLASTDKFW